MTQEIERKFLVKDMPLEQLRMASAEHLEQGYLFLEENRELRVRKKNQRYYLTSKQGEGLVREEVESEINEETFKILWPFTLGQRLEKKRFTFVFQKHKCEVDIYGGVLDKLIVLEVEFASEEEARSFTPPSYCIREITEDRHYKNACLAKLGIPV